MKKLILLILLFSVPVFAADTKVTGLSALTDVNDADLLYVIDDVAGTATSKKITVLNLFDTIDTSAELLAILTDETGTGSVVFSTSPHFVTSVFAPKIIFDDADHNPTSTGDFLYDSTVTGIAGGCFAFQDCSATDRYVVDLGTLPTVDDSVVAYDADNDKYYMIDSTNWDTAYGWGNHASGGYLTAETDPCFVASDVYSVATADISTWDTAYGWGNHASAGYLTAETDPCFALSDVNDVTSTDISNWNTAYGWGDWSGEGFLTAESDPCHAAWLLTDPLSGLLSTETGIEPNDLVVIDSNSVIAEKMKHLNITLTSPADIACADMIPIWHNTSGYTFNIVEIQAWSDTDNVSLEVEEIPSETDFSTPTQVQAVEIATDGTSCYYIDYTTITAPVIETEHLLAIDFDTNDDPNYVKMTITGYYSD